MASAAKLAMAAALALALAAPVLPVAGQDGAPERAAAPAAGAGEAVAASLEPAPAGAGAGKPPAPPAPFGRPLDERRLAGLRGGSDTPWSDMKLQGAVSGNSAVAVATGANVITEGAFSNASGLPMVIQNSGANVLIQNATIVNVQFK